MNKIQKENKFFFSFSNENDYNARHILTRCKTKIGGNHPPISLPSCHPVDGFHVFRRQDLEGDTGFFVVTAALARHLTNFFVGDVATDEFLDVDGHADGVIETLHSLDASESSTLGIGEVVGNIHHIHGETHEA